MWPFRPQLLHVADAIRNIDRHAVAPHHLHRAVKDAQAAHLLLDDHAVGAACRDAHALDRHLSRVDASAHAQIAHATGGAMVYALASGTGACRSGAMLHG